MPKRSPVRSASNPSAPTTAASSAFRTFKVWGVALIMGQIDGSHPTFAKLTLDAVAAFEGGVQAGDGVRHDASPLNPPLFEQRLVSGGW